MRSLMFWLRFKHIGMLAIRVDSHVLVRAFLFVWFIRKCPNVRGHRVDRVRCPADVSWWRERTVAYDTLDG